MNASAPCTPCHRLVDPIGYGFEEFDAVGRYRSTDHGAPVDTSGNLVDLDGTDVPFVGAAELARRLAVSSAVQDCLARQWFRFALARMETNAGVCSLESARRALETSRN